MVFQKKGATPAKNFQPKKKGKKQQVEADIDMFKDMDDSDDSNINFEDDSEDDMPVQKTPKNKTPKGRQSLSEKKVTFNMSGKNTPVKTPNKNNSLVGKKTPTPAKAKGALQEFKGIKGGKPQKKGQVEEDDDDDDDDDDDEDEDDDMDELDEGDDLDGDDDDDDDDDDDEDDDDDDEDDDDDDDDEEEEQAPKQKLSNKQKNNVEQNKQKAPVKNENAKNQTPKKEAASPKKETGSPLKNPETQSLEMQRRKERDVKMLYVGGLPGDVTPEELKSLSPDIKNVIIPKSNRNKNIKNAFAFLCFASEAKAEANHKVLQSKKFRGQLLNIDFVGDKSKKKPKSSEPQINERKLYVTGIPVDATLDQVAVYFPKAYQISFNKSPSFRSASINFEKVEDATEAFKSNKDIEINGSKLIVVHSTSSNMSKRSKKRKHQKKQGNGNANQGGNPAKKMKFAKQEESSDEE